MGLIWVTSGAALGDNWGCFGAQVGLFWVTAGAAAGVSSCPLLPQLVVLNLPDPDTPPFPSLPSNYTV